jgi:hypothetical protein
VVEKFVLTAPEIKCGILAKISNVIQSILMSTRKDMGTSMTPRMGI